MTMESNKNNKLKIKFAKYNRKGFLKFEQNGKHPILKNVFNKILKPSTVILLIAVYIVGLNFGQYIGDLIAAQQRANLHPDGNTTDFLTEVPTNVDGTIIENPVVNEEIANAYEFLTEKVVGDLDFFGVNLPNISKICGIYKHALYGESFSKDAAIQIILEAEGKKYILEYTAAESDFENEVFTVNTSINENETILSFMENLANCYVSNFIQNDDIKEEIASHFDNFDGVIGDVIYYTKDALTTLYQIPVYSNNECTVYSISENDLAENSEDMSLFDVYKLFGEYLENKNDLFTSEKVEKIDTNDDVIKAIEYAKYVASQLDTFGFLKVGETKVKVENPEDYGLEP